MTDADTSPFFRPVNTPIYDMVASGSLERVTTDRGAIESIANGILAEFALFGNLHGRAIELSRADLIRILHTGLDRLTADGYSVVKTETLRELEGAYALQQIRTRKVDRWLPVPEGSEDEQ